mgnify:CR=1 FL=1
METKYDWRYQAIKHDGWYGLHEVHLADGVVHNWTESPITFTGDSPSEILKSLQMAINDCKKLPVFEMPDGD